MGVSVQLPGPLAAHAGGRGRVELTGSPETVGEALEALFALHPGLRDRVLTEEGRVRSHVNVFVGGESIRFASGLATRVAGKEIVILPAISGG